MNKSPFRYIYSDGNSIRVRVPGNQSKSFNIDALGTKKAMNIAIKYRDRLVTKNV